MYLVLAIVFVWALLILVFAGAMAFATKRPKHWGQIMRDAKRQKDRKQS